MPRLATLLAAVVATGSTLLAPTAAHAGRLGVSDGAGDAQKLDWRRSDKNNPVFLAAPEETSVDIVRTIVAHRRASLDVTVRFRDLRRLDGHETTVRVVTSTRDRVVVRMIARPGGGMKAVLTRNERAFTCSGVRTLQQVPRDRVELSLPTACLDAPRWVRVGVMAEGVEDTATAAHPNDFEMYFDDASRRSLDLETGPALGPRLSRG